MAKEGFVKSKGLTPEEKLALGPVPPHFPEAWLGRDPEGDEVYLEVYLEDPYGLYHDWPYRCEGAVFHNRQTCLDFAWSLSRNQGYRTVWIESPSGFPEKTSWWDQDRLERDGEWTEEGRARVEKIQQGLLDPDQPTLDTQVPEPSRAEANGRVRAYYDTTLKKVVKTGEPLEPDSPVRAEHKARLLRRKASD